MTEQTQRVSIGELKFRAMVSDLMTMPYPAMVIHCPTSSKARSLRRMFYTWGKNIAERERIFLEKIEYKLVGRTITVQEKASWLPVEKGVEDVSESQGEPARNSGLDNRQ